MTMSLLSSFGPGAVSPAMILTRATRASAKTTPMNDRLPVTGRGRRVAAAKSNWPRLPPVVLDESTSVTVSCPIPQGTAIRRVDVGKDHAEAGGSRRCIAVAPWNENSTTVTLLPIGEKSRSGLNAWKSWHSSNCQTCLPGPTEAPGQSRYREW